MPLPDLSRFLQISARLIDLHDSRRTYGESPIYQGESRAGNQDGRYVALATTCLYALQELGRRSGDEYAPLELIAHFVRDELPFAEKVDVEYVLNVLARPTELKLLVGQVGHLISEKDTNLADKSPNVAEFRLSRMGRLALGLAMNSNEEYQDIAYIEGDVTKLIRALENGKLKAALGFLDQLNEQLRVAHTSLVSLIERGGRALRAAHAELTGHTEIMMRTNEQVRSAESRINEIIRSDIEIDDEEVPIGLVRERVRELSRGIVRYSRQLSQLTAETSRGISSSVDAPSFAVLAKQWVISPATLGRIDQVMAALGPGRIQGITPMGIDFAGSVKQRIYIERPLEQIDLGDYAEPPEHEFTRWLQANRARIEAMIRDGGLTLEEAIAGGLAGQGADEALACLVTALTSIDSWLDMTGLALGMEEHMTKVKLPAMDAMFSSLSVTQDLVRSEKAIQEAR